MFHFTNKGVDYATYYSDNKSELANRSPYKYEFAN